MKPDTYGRPNRSIMIAAQISMDSAMSVSQIRSSTDVQFTVER